MGIFKVVSCFYTHNLLMVIMIKIEIVESDNKSELDRLINACIQDRDVFDIKLATVLHQGKIQYTALIILRT